MQFLHLITDKEQFNALRDHQTDILIPGKDWPARISVGDEVTLSCRENPAESLRVEVIEEGGQDGIRVALLEWILMMEEDPNSLEKEFEEEGLIDYTGLLS